MTENNDSNIKEIDLKNPVVFSEGIYKESIQLPNMPKALTLSINAPCKTPMAKEMLNIINNFDKTTWSAINKGVVTGYPMLDKAFQKGLPSGFYIIAGDSNTGKTTYLTQITWQMLNNNDDIFILDFSLDDPEIDKVSRLVGSWVQINSTDVKFPKDKDEKTLLARRIGLNNLVNNSDKYLCRDSTFGNSIEKIEEEIKRVKIELETLRPGTKLVVCIDSFHDLCIDAEQNLTETMKFNKLAQRVADLAIQYDLVLLCTGELRKMERDNIRPSLNSLRESIKIKYEAKAIMLVYNDIHFNQESAEIFYLDKNQKKQPVLEVHIAKNKISSYKGRLFYYMWPDKGFLQECDATTSQNFRNTINK